MLEFNGGACGLLYQVFFKKTSCVVITRTLQSTQFVGTRMGKSFTGKKILSNELSLKYCSTGACKVNM